jgi:hypothetical protein
MGSQKHTVFLQTFSMSPRRWAKACQIRPATIYDAIRSGELKVSDFGRQARITVMQMSDWFDAHERKVPGDDD